MPLTHSSMLMRVAHRDDAVLGGGVGGPLSAPTQRPAKEAVWISTPSFCARIIGSAAVTQ